jgi:hypothetical protein
MHETIIRLSELQPTCSVDVIRVVAEQCAVQLLDD